MLPTPGFHHLHLNSVDPAAAIDWYARQFPRCTKGEWAGFPALLSPNNVMVLFTKVDRPPPSSPQSAIWHFGWHVTDVRKSLTAFQAARRGEAAAALHDRRGRIGAGEQRHLAECRRHAWPHAGADCRGAAPRACSRRAAAGLPTWRGPDNALVEYRRELSGRAVQPRASVAGGAAVRAALVSEAPERAGARGLCGTAADRGGMQGAARRGPHLAGAQPRGDVPHAARRRGVRRRGADLVRQPGRHAAGQSAAASCRTTSP